MRKTAFIMSALFFIFAIFLSIRVFHLAREEKIQFNMIQRETQKINAQITQKQSLPDGPVDALDRNLKSFYKVIQFISQQSNFKRSFNIGSEIQKSDWEGIRKATIVLNFYDLDDYQSFLKIIKPLEELNQRIPMDIVLLKQHGKGLNVQILIYGL